jgi:RNA polymerase sigma-70 factor (ECF subfamily)
MHASFAISLAWRSRARAHSSGDNLSPILVGWFELAGAQSEIELERDEAAWRAVADGDTRALTELYDRHAPMLVGVAYRLLGNRSDAEDLVHDVFVEAWGRARDFDARRGSVRRWLLVRLRSRAIDRIRSLETARRHRETEASERAAAPPANPEWSPGDGERVRAALRALPEEQRTLVELAYFEGLSHAELALRAGVPIGTVKSRLFAAMEKLRRQLDAPRGLN